jgi:hypothetical protein
MDIQNTNSKVNSKLEALREKFKKVQAQIGQLEAKDKAKGRREDTRLKILIGAAHLADALQHDETRAGVRAVLDRAITAPHDREFLKQKGWL